MFTSYSIPHCAFCFLLSLRILSYWLLLFGVYLCQCPSLTAVFENWRRDNFIKPQFCILSSFIAYYTMNCSGPATCFSCPLLYRVLIFTGWFDPPGRLHFNITALLGIEIGTYRFVLRHHTRCADYRAHIIYLGLLRENLLILL